VLLIVSIICFACCLDSAYFDGLNLVLVCDFLFEVIFTCLLFILDLFFSVPFSIGF